MPRLRLYAYFCDKLIPLLFFASCLSLPVALSAQWSIGFGGGFNLAYSNLTFQEDLSNINQRSNLVGLTIALPVEVPSGKMFSLRTGLTFIQKGTRFNYLEASPGRFYDTKYIMDYLEIPLLAKATFSVQPFNFYVLGGLQPGYAVNMRVVRISTNPDIPIKETFPVDFKEAGISRMDLGLVMGGGVEAEIAKGRRIFVEMQYHFGVRDISRRTDTEVFNEGRTFNMGMLIPLRKKERFITPLKK